MSMDVVIRDVGTGTGSKVNTAGQALISGETDSINNPGNVACVRAMEENDLGTVTGAAYLKSIEASLDYRSRVGMDSILFSYTFNASAQDTDSWLYAFSTLTATQPGNGYLQFGTVQGTASGHGAYMQSRQRFSLLGTAPIACEITMGLFTATLVSNEVCLMGLGIPAAAGTRPTDGVWLELSTSGLVLTMMFNTAVTSTSPLRALAHFTVGQMYKLVLVVGERDVEVWEDDVLIGAAALPTSMSFQSGMPAANGQPCQMASQPAFVQKYCNGVVSNTNTFRVSDITVSQMDTPQGLDAPTLQAFQGLMGYGGLPGGTMGSQQFVGTITTGSSPITPTSAAGSNSTPAMTTLGGVCAINAAAAAATDFILMGWTNPAGSVTQTPRTYVMTGIFIQAYNFGAAVATTPTTVVYSIGYGSTAATLNTTESTSFTTATVKAARRVALGVNSAAIAAAIGAVYSPDIIRDFSKGPIVVRPGEVLHVIGKIVVGTATASQIIEFLITPIGYFI